MSTQCKCVNSYLHPHRVDMCLIYGSRREVVSAPAGVEPPLSIPFAEAAILSPECAVPGDSSPADEGDIIDEQIDDLKPLPVADQVPEYAASNATLLDGNERCDCFMFRIQKHRKFRCAWKNHGLSMAGAAVVGAAIMSSMLIGGERNDASCVPEGDGQLIPASPASAHGEDATAAKVRQNDAQTAAARTLPAPAVNAVSAAPELDWRHGDAEVPTAGQKVGGQAVSEEDLEDEHATNARLAFQDARMREREITCERLYRERVAEQKRQADLKRQKQEQEQREREEDARVAQWMDDAEFDLDTFQI